MFKEFKIYTAGKMTGLKFEDQMRWRSDFSNSIHSFSGGNYPITLFHPPLFFDEENCQSDNEVMEFDLGHMLQCDIVVVNLENINSSIGTIMELATIRAHNRSGGKHIFVVGIGKSEEQHPWVRCCVSRFVEDTDEAAKYIRNFFFV